MKEAPTTAVHPEAFLPNYLSTKMKTKCLSLLVEYKALYDGHLGRMRFPYYKLPIKPDYRSVHAKVYPIARSQEVKAKETIQRLISADVIEQIYDAEMASPAFFVSKPDLSLRLLKDYRGLNKYLRRSPYYVPRIREILMRLSNAWCLSTFDANHGYYARRLARKSRPLTAFCLPFGKYL